MNIINKLKRVVRKGAILGMLSAAIAGGGLIATHTTPVEAATSCDKVNIIYCGLNGSTLSNQITSFKKDYDTNASGQSYKDVQTVYDYVGATKATVDAMSTSNTLSGAVQRNGDVVAGGKVIATNAYVAARFSVSGAKLIPGTNAYLRATTSSFAQASEPAIIRVDGNGKMLFAAIIGCGNAVKATPKVTPPAPKPSYSINKLVAVKGSSSYVKAVNVKSGTHVEYKITYTSTGNTPVTNLTLKDALPNGVQYVTSTLKRDGAALATSFFTSGVNVGTLKNGASTTITFEAIVGPSDTPQVCTAQTLVNTASMTATSLVTETSTATVNKACVPKPVYACTSLSQQAVSRTVFNFTAQATGSNGAVLTGYVFDFGDGTPVQTVTTAAASTVKQHTYANAGTYNIVASAVFTVPGLSGPQTVTSAGCKTSVTVKPAPVAECTDLKLIQNTTNPRLVTATASYTASNGATLTDVSFDWGEGTAATDNKTNVTANHTFSKDGTFTVVATLKFSAGTETVAPSTCQAPITVTTVMPTCDKLTIDVNNDDKTVTIASFSKTDNNGTYQSTTLDWGDGSQPVVATDITGQSHQYSAVKTYTVIATPSFLVNGQATNVPGTACQASVTFTTTPTPPVTPPVTPPTKLVNTGAGSVAGLFAATTAISAIGYRLFLGRRLSNEA